MIVQDQFVWYCWRCLLELWAFGWQWWAPCNIVRHTDHRGVLVRRAVVCVNCALKAGRQSGCRSHGKGEGVRHSSGQSPWGCQGWIPLFVRLSLRLSGNSREQEFWQLQNPPSCDSHGGDRAGNLTVAMSPWVSSHKEKHSSFLRAEYEMSPSVLTHIPPGSAIGVVHLHISNMAFPCCVCLWTSLSDLLQF